MKKILAVSGGVDSMVLLDIYKNDPEVVVAHFNHGTRPSADDDQAFVEQKCGTLHIQFFTQKANLGPNVSEEIARAKRYDFFNQIARQISANKNLANDEFPNDVKIYTAHHADDLAESVFINLLRGTGWRGLCPFSRPEVVRPFLDFDDVLLPRSKADILSYASYHKISFRQDPTNVSDKYLRNRIREKLSTLEPQMKFDLLEKIYKLYKKQLLIKSEILEIEQNILPQDGIYNRADFMKMDDTVALEILKVLTSETEPTCERFLNAIRTYAPEKSYNLSDDKLIKIHKNYFKI